MDVLERRVPAELAVLDVAPEALEPGDERRDVVVGQDAGPAEAADVGDRAVEVVERELRVDVDRAPEGGDALGLVGPDRASSLASEPSAPELASRLPPQSCRDPAGTRVIVASEPVPSTCNDGAGHLFRSGDGPVSTDPWLSRLGQHTTRSEDP